MRIKALFAGLFFFGGISVVACGIYELNHPAMLVWLGGCAMWLGKRIASS